MMWRIVSEDCDQINVITACAHIYLCEKGNKLRN